MILIGQYDSPFVRRVGVALSLYQLPFEHRPWSTFADADKIRPYNPLVRVPTLVLDSDEVLIESHHIIDHLDGLVSVDRRMYPAAEPVRHQALKIAALATGLADKAVILFYENRLHNHVSQIWVDRCCSQINAAIAALESARCGATSNYWFGNRIGHSDIAVACAIRFVVEAHPGLVSPNDFPLLAADAARLEALPVFQSISQRFIPPS